VTIWRLAAGTPGGRRKFPETEPACARRRGRRDILEFGLLVPRMSDRAGSAGARRFRFRSVGAASSQHARMLMCASWPVESPAAFHAIAVGCGPLPDASSIGFRRNHGADVRRNPSDPASPCPDCGPRPAPHRRGFRVQQGPPPLADERSAGPLDSELRSAEQLALGLLFGMHRIDFDDEYVLPAAVRAKWIRRFFLFERALVLGF